MVSFYKIVLVSILFLVSVSGVCAVDTDLNNDSFIKDKNVLNSLNASKFDTNDLNNSNDIVISFDLNNSNIYKLNNNLTYDSLNKSTNITNQKLLIQMLQGKFKDLSIGKVMQDIAKEDFKKHENNVYTVQLKALSNSIIHNLNSIDYEINKTLNGDFSLLINQINLLKNKNVNQSRVIDNSLKKCDKCLYDINGYFYIFRGYLNEINDYLTLRESLKNKNISINDNDIINIDNSIINSINSKVKCLYVLKCKIEDIATCLNRINSIVKL